MAPIWLVSLVHLLHYCWVTLMLLSHTTSSNLDKPLLLKKICRFAVLCTHYVQATPVCVVKLKALWNCMLPCSSGVPDFFYLTGASRSRLCFPTLTDLKASLIFTSSTSLLCNTDLASPSLAGQCVQMAAVLQAAGAAETAIELCVLIGRGDVLWGEVYPRYLACSQQPALLERLLPHILASKLPSLPPEVMQVCFLIRMSHFSFTLPRRKFAGFSLVTDDFGLT